jgi:hypothetical protein
MNAISKIAAFAPNHLTLDVARPQPAPSTPAHQSALVQELPLDLLDQVGGGSGLTLII